MNIVLTHTHFIHYWPARIRVLAERLGAGGHELLVVEIAGRDSLYPFAARRRAAADNLQWVCLFEEADQKSLGVRSVSRALFATLEKSRPDVVLSSAIAFPTGATAVRWCRKRRRRVVIMDNARLNDVPRSPLVNYLKKRIYRNVDAVLVPAPSHAHSYVQWGVDPERIFFGLNVTDNDLFRCASDRLHQTRQAARARRGLPQRFFLGLGRQIQVKNWATLIEAYRQYRQRADGKAWALVLVGDGPERSSLEALVSGHEIQDVHFHAACSPAETCDFYASAGALVLPSYTETWGLVVNEAMACGLPVLVSRQCGCAESLVRDGENGWTFSPEDPGELGQALLRMARLDDAERAAMGAQSREIIAEWPLERFAEGAMAAIEACNGASRGFCSLGDKLLLSLWKGRYRPT